MAYKSPFSGWAASAGPLTTELGMLLSSPCPAPRSNRFDSFVRAAYALPEGVEKRIKWTQDSTGFGRPWELGASLELSQRNTIRDEKWLRKELDAKYPEISSIRVEEFGGLRNLGATCYVNATLQSLFMNVEFRKLILSISGRATAAEALRCLGGVFEALEGSKRAVVDPRRFIDACRLSHGVQEDTSEFGNLLFNWLDEQTSEISRLFAGNFVHTTVCKSCGFLSNREERFFELTVNFPEITADRKFQLEDLLQMTEEEISDYHCSGCDERVEVVRRTKIGNFPKYLRVVINRYTYNESGRVKLLNTVGFPSENLTISDHIYDLGAYLEHHSRRASDGHYIATARLHEAGADCRPETFWKFNDSVVEAVTPTLIPEVPVKKLRRLSEIAKPLARDEERIESSGVYMLVFASRGSSTVDRSRTSELSAELAAENVALMFSADEFKQRSALRDRSRETRLREVDEMISNLSSIEISDAAEELCFVDRQVLHDWAKGIDCSDQILDQANFSKTRLCEHGKFSPVALARGDIKVLPRYLTPEIVGHFRVSSSVCADCVQMYARDFRSFREFELILKNLTSDVDEDEELQYVNKNCLPKLRVRQVQGESFDTAAFRKFKEIVDKTESEELDLSADLTCSHGNLDKRKKVAIPVLSDLVNKLLSLSEVIRFVPRLRMTISFNANDVKVCRMCSDDVRERKRLENEIAGMLTGEVEIGSRCVLLPLKNSDEDMMGWARRMDFEALYADVVCQHGLVNVDVRDLLDQSSLANAADKSTVRRAVNSQWLLLAKHEAESVFPLNHLWAEVNVVGATEVDGWGICHECAAERTRKEGDALISNLKISCRLSQDVKPDFAYRSTRSSRASELCQISGITGDMTGENIKLLIVTHLADTGKFVKDIKKINVFVGLKFPDNMFKNDRVRLSDDHTVREIHNARFQAHSWKTFVNSITDMQVTGDVENLAIPKALVSTAVFELLDEDESPETSAPVSKSASTSDFDAGMQGSIFRI